MTVPFDYANTYIPVKYFLTSYRAFSDGKSGVRYLEKHLKSSKYPFLSDWKVVWIGACALLRTSIELFKVDAESCVNQKIRKEFKNEWHSIGKNKENHAIFWEFLRKERNQIVHHYEWAAYEIWMDQDGTTRDIPMSLLTIKPEDVDAVLIMRDGPYKNRNSLDLLKESADWVEERIVSAIRRSGFDPDEERNLKTFEKHSPDLAATTTMLEKMLGSRPR